MPGVRLRRQGRCQGMAQIDQALKARAEQFLSAKSGAVASNGEGVKLQETRVQRGEILQHRHVCLSQK